MRKFVSIALILLLLLVPTLAAAKELNTKLFSAAKQALSLISYGETKKALKALGLSTSDEAVDAMRQFLKENLDTLAGSSVQTDVAVCYRFDKGYRLAIPLESPDFPDVQALVLKSKDGQSFSGYTAMEWSDVKAEVAESELVKWDEAYKPNKPMLVADE